MKKIELRCDEQRFIEKKQIFFVMKKKIISHWLFKKRTPSKNHIISKRKKWVSWEHDANRAQFPRIKTSTAQFFFPIFSKCFCSLWSFSSTDLSTLEDAWMLNGICRHVQKKMKVEPSCCTKKLSQKFDLHCS